MSVAVTNPSAIQELRDAQAEADAISRETGKITEQQRNRFNFLLSKIASIKQGYVPDDERRAKSLALAKELGLPITPQVSEEQREHNRQSAELRNYLIQGREARTYSGMSVAVNSGGGFYCPASFYTSVTAALKQADGLWSDDVITLFEDSHGNALTCPLVDDTSISAVQIAENVTSIEDEIPVIDKLTLGKIPTWRSKKLVASLELIQDSGFPLESAILAPAIAKRFQRGISAANVATLLSSTTSGATSVTPTSVSLDDTLNLLDSVNPSYLTQPKTFFGMNFHTLVSLLKQKDSQGRYQWKPLKDANGRLLLHNIPVVLMPSLPSASANAQGTVVLGDFSKCLRRTVRNSMVIMRYEQTVSLAENGLVAFEGFLRSSFGVLSSASSDSPIKFLTQSA